MIRLDLPEEELYNSATNEFSTLKKMSLSLEHSLISISKWEAKWKKAFINNMDKLTDEEFLDYVRCMIIGKDDTDLSRLKLNEFNIIRGYINNSMTATTFPNKPGAPSREIITSEVIYSWMVGLRIPFDPCEKWHINRLLTLIQICSDDRQPKKKMSMKETMAMYARINAERRAKLNSKG